MMWWNDYVILSLFWELGSCETWNDNRSTRPRKEYMIWQLSSTGLVSKIMKHIGKKIFQGSLFYWYALWNVSWEAGKYWKGWKWCWTIVHFRKKNLIRKASCYQSKRSICGCWSTTMWRIKKRKYRQLLIRSWFFCVLGFWLLGDFFSCLKRRFCTKK